MAYEDMKSPPVQLSFIFYVICIHVCEEDEVEASSQYI